MKIRKHLNTVHFHDNPVAMECSSLSVGTDMDQLEKIRRSILADLVNTIEAIHVCEICEADCPSRKCLEIHMMLCHGESGFVDEQCNICGEYFMSAKALHLHQLDMH